MRYVKDEKHRPDKQEKQGIERAEAEEKDPAGTKPTKVRGKKENKDPDKDPHNKWDGM